MPAVTRWGQPSWRRYVGLRPHGAEEWAGGCYRYQQPADAGHLWVLDLGQLGDDLAGVEGAWVGSYPADAQDEAEVDVDEGAVLLVVQDVCVVPVLVRSVSHTS